VFKKENDGGKNAKKNSKILKPSSKSLLRPDESSAHEDGHIIRSVNRGQSVGSGSKLMREKTLSASSDLVDIEHNYGGMNSKPNSLARNTTPIRLLAGGGHHEDIKQSGTKTELSSSPGRRTTPRYHRACDSADPTTNMFHDGVSTQKKVFSERELGYLYNVAGMDVDAVERQLDCILAFRKNGFLEDERGPLLRKDVAFLTGVARVFQPFVCHR